MQTIRTGRTVLEVIQTEDGPEEQEIQRNTCCFKTKNGDVTVGVSIIVTNPSVQTEKLTAKLEQMGRDLVKYAECPNQVAIPFDPETGEVREVRKAVRA